MAVLKEESTLTDRYQTTVPAAVRRTLNLSKRDRVVYEVQNNGTVILSRADPAQDDPALGQFLDLLQHDIASGNARPVTQAMLEQSRALIGNIEVDLNAPLANEDED